MAQKLVHDDGPDATLLVGQRDTIFPTPAAEIESLRETIARLTAQLDAWTVEHRRDCGGTGRRYWVDAEGPHDVECEECKGTGRVLRCQGRLEAAEKMRADLAAWVESAQAYDAAVKAEKDLSSAKEQPRG